MILEALSIHALVLSIHAPTFGMAHHLIDFEDVCGEIRERLAALGVEDRPSLTLTELFADGKVRTLPVTEEFLETYIEQDFGDISVVGNTAQGPHGFTIKLMSGFILHSVPGGSWPACFGASFTYNSPRQCMYIFLCTYSASNTGTLFSSAIDLSSFGTPLRSPFLLPSAITRLNLDARARSLDRIKNEIYELELALGDRRDHEKHVDVRTLDYSQLSRDINALNARLSWTMHSCKQTKRLLDFMDTVAVRYTSMALTHHYSLNEADTVERNLLSLHSYLRSWNQGLIDRVDYLTSRLQASSQSVYSGIAQRDSASSISIGITSTKLAETSQQVAIATSRDSAVMRVITAVTVVFLPGTFTATFSSTTFVNFGEGINGHVYSKWLWLYFVVTIALTTIVIGGTWALWRSKEREIIRQSDEADAASDKTA
ncbi:hypothetical protein E8E11_010467 [Didymella keratinophila]|nr:hypothetical protein E8E11_010467 [Didymella keratinophila]